MNAKGNILIEAVILIGVLLFISLSSVEVARRGYLKVLIVHSCFLYGRERLLGATEPASIREVERFITKTGTGLRVDSWKFEDELISHALEARVFYRYRTLLRFPVGTQEKHHMEVSATCRFPLS